MVATTGMHRTSNKFSEDLSFPAFSVSSFDDDYVASSSNILILNPMPMEPRGLVGETREWCAFTAYSTDFIAFSHSLCRKYWSISQVILLCSLNDCRHSYTHICMFASAAQTCLQLDGSKYANGVQCNAIPCVNNSLKS